MKYTVKITAFENDADYIEAETTIENYEIDRIKRIAAIIWSFPKRRWYTYEQKHGENDPYVIYKSFIPKNDIDFFNNLVPCSEFGIHTIISIEIREVNTLFEFSKF